MEQDMPVQDVLSLILGGGRGKRLYPLTKRRSEPAVPIAGKYRLIDIPVSNCLNSNLKRIYVLTQFLSASLHRHIGNTYKFDPFSRSFVGVLAAQQTNEAADWYQGTADAIRQNIRYVQEDGARDILILSADQLYRFDFGKLIQVHRGSGADVTMGIVPVTRERVASLGVVRLDDHNRVTELVEKPQDAAQLDALRVAPARLEQRGITAGGREYLANMGIYLIKREVLFGLLDEQPGAHDFYTQLLAPHVGKLLVQAYLFDGYWEDLGTIKSYHAASLALAGDDPPFDFNTPDGVIYTRMRYLPASRVSSADVSRCLISDGCVVQAGTRIAGCLVGVRSRIGRNVTLEDTVIIGADRFETEAEQEKNRQRGTPSLGVGDGSVIKRAILDKDCRVGKNVQIINRANVENGEGEYYVIRDGIVVIPNDAVVPDGTVI
jgi:glucose-1-phosphate adenylyltransferase